MKNLQIINRLFSGKIGHNFQRSPIHFVALLILLLVCLLNDRLLFT